MQQIFGNFGLKAEYSVWPDNTIFVLAIQPNIKAKSFIFTINNVNAF